MAVKYHPKKASRMNKLAYLRDSPAGCIDSADVHLILDSGDELPVHSAFPDHTFGGVSRNSNINKV
jgi:hypothetical protein